MTTPYTYLIGWTRQQKFYYGVRFARGCKPSDLWVKYFTSSKHVKVAREQFGEPDIVQVRRIFNNVDRAKDWEHKVLRRMKASCRKDFLNLTDNRCNPSNAGIVRTEEFKRKMSVANRGKKLSEEHKRKIAKAVSGKRPPEFGRAVSESMVGRKLTREHAANIRKANVGKKRSEEFRQQRREQASIKVMGPDGTVYSSLLAAKQATGQDAKRLSLRPDTGWVRLTGIPAN